MIRLLPLVSVAASVGLSLLANEPASGTGQCALLVDGSGSTADYPAVRAWAFQEVGWILEAHASTAPAVPLQFGVFDEELSIIEAPAWTSTQADRDEIIQSLNDSVKPSRWTNPATALQALALTPDLTCTLVVTDGSVDPPPGHDAEGIHNAAIVSAELLRGRSVPVVVVALTVPADLWKEVVELTGGLVLVDPDQGQIREALAQLLAPTPTPFSREIAEVGVTGGPTPVISETTSPTTRLSPARGEDAAVPAVVWWALPGVPLAILLVAVVLRRPKPRLEGALDHLHGEDEDDPI